MISWFNYYSYIIFGIIVLAAIVFLVISTKNPWIRGLIVFSALGILAIGQFSLRAENNQDANKFATDSSFNIGTPILVEFYSNF
jgi:hypothetical protein